MYVAVFCPCSCQWSRRRVEAAAELEQRDKLVHDALCSALLLGIMWKVWSGTGWASLMHQSGIWLKLYLRFLLEQSATSIGHLTHHSSGQIKHRSQINTAWPPVSRCRKCGVSAPPITHRLTVPKDLALSANAKKRITKFCEDIKWKIK